MENNITAQAAQASGSVCHVFFSQTLLKQYWRLALQAKDESARSELLLQNVNWKIVKEIAEDINVNGRASNDHEIWLRSLKDSIDCVSYSVMYLEAAVNEIAIQGKSSWMTRVSVRGQHQLMANLLSIIAKSPASLNSNIDGDIVKELSRKCEEAKALACGQGSVQERQIVQDFMNHALTALSVGLTKEDGSPDSFINICGAWELLVSKKLEMNAVEKVRLWCSLLKGVASIPTVCPAAAMLERVQYIIDLRNWLKHGKGFMDLSTLDLTDSSQAYTHKVLNARMVARDAKRKKARDKIENMLKGKVVKNRPIPLLPYGWVGIDICTWVTKEVGDLALKIEEMLISAGDESKGCGAFDIIRHP